MQSSNAVRGIIQQDSREARNKISHRQHELTQKIQAVCNVVSEEWGHLQTVEDLQNVVSSINNVLTQVVNLYQGQETVTEINHKIDYLRLDVKRGVVGKVEELKARENELGNLLNKRRRIYTSMKGSLALSNHVDKFIGSFATIAKAIENEIILEETDLPVRRDTNYTDRVDIFDLPDCKRECRFCDYVDQNSHH